MPENLILLAQPPASIELGENLNLSNHPELVLPLFSILNQDYRASLYHQTELPPAIFDWLQAQVNTPAEPEISTFTPNIIHPIFQPAVEPLGTYIPNPAVIKWGQPEILPFKGQEIVLQPWRPAILKPSPQFQPKITPVTAPFVIPDPIIVARTNQPFSAAEIYQYGTLLKEFTLANTAAANLNPEINFYQNCRTAIFFLQRVGQALAKTINTQSPLLPFSPASLIRLLYPYLLKTSENFNALLKQQQWQNNIVLPKL